MTSEDSLWESVLSFLHLHPRIELKFSGLVTYWVNLEALDIGMYGCVYVYAHACMHAWVYMWVHVHACLCTCLFIFISMSLSYLENPLSSFTLSNDLYATILSMASPSSTPAIIPCYFPGVCNYFRVCTHTWRCGAKSLWQERACDFFFWVWVSLLNMNFWFHLFISVLVRDHWSIE